MPAPVIDAKNLVKAYKVKGKPDFLAVDGISFEVAPGRVLRAARPERRRQVDHHEDDRRGLDAHAAAT